MHFKQTQLLSYRGLLTGSVGNVNAYVIRIYKLLIIINK